MRRATTIPAVLGLVTMVVVWSSCERPTQAPNPNNPPTTTLANVPQDRDTVFPLASMRWTGGDKDGYVARYQYRYYTYHRVPGDTVWAPFDSTSWHDKSATTVVIAFNSSDDINKQLFLVRAIDNEGAVDPHPASRILYTTKASPPKTTILSPGAGISMLALEQTTDWWQGVKLQFSAKDQTAGGEVVAYAYSVDGGMFKWGSDTLIYLVPSEFKTPVTGTHYVKAISRNNTNLVDAVGDSVSFRLLRPPFVKPVLIIDETDEFNLPFITNNIPDDSIDNYYARVFPGSDSWDFKKKGMPPRDTMAQYKLVVWHADDWPVSVPHKISDPRNIEVFTDYLAVGGKFVMSGWGILKSFAYYSNFPYSFGSGTFVYDYLHIRTVDVTSRSGDCTGGLSALAQFTDFKVDSAKWAFFPFSGLMGEVNLITTPAGFTAALYTYDNLPTSPNVRWRGRPIALRYYGTSFDAIVLGFPMYFVREDHAKLMAQQILHSLNVQ